jgi:hypothetical protein
MPVFLNPILLPGLLVVAVPVIIHLINRNRYQVVPWGAYQLLTASFQVRARRIRLEELLLLLLRMLVLACFVLALCRIVFYHKGLHWGDPLTSNVILLDGSYSMGRETGDGPLFDKARKRAICLIEELRKGEDVSVVVVGRLPERFSTRPEFEFDGLIRIIRDYRLQEQPADFTEGMKLALEILSETRNPVRRLFVISDLQDFGWRSGEASKWAHLKALLAELHLHVSAYYLWEEVAPKPNFSVTPVRLQGVSVNTLEPAKFAFSVNNHHMKPAACSVTIETDDREVERRERTLEPGETREEVFEVRLERPGFHTLVARIDRDFVPGDNGSYMAVEALDAIPVLVVDGAYGEDFLRSGAACFAAALNPESRSGEKTPFRPKRIPAHLLQDEKLSDYRAVVLANVGDLAQEQAARLERFVSSGGGLLVSCGDNVRPAEMTRTLYRDGEGLLPASLVRPQPVPEGERPFSPFFPKGGTEVFPFLAAEEGRRLAEVLLNRFMECEVTPSDRERGAEVLAEIADQKPFVVTRKFGSGRVVLSTSSLDLSWGNFPSQWVYVPVVNHLMLYLSTPNQNESQVTQGDKFAISFDSGATGFPGGSGSTDIRATTPETGRTGPPHPVPDTRYPIPVTRIPNTQYPIPNAAAAGVIYVKKPDGEVEELPARKEGDGLALDYVSTCRPGIYLASTDREFRDETTKAFSVNVDLRESELRPMDEEFRRFLTDSFSMEFCEGYDQFTKASPKQGSFDAWRWLILAALAALLLESYVTARIAEGQRPISGIGYRVSD